jgi:cell division protein ZapA (FtsZ GTPase activity inhibitor)
LILCKSSDGTTCPAGKTPLSTFVSQAAHLTVWAGENAAYLEALAAEVDTRIQQIYTTSVQISPLRAAIMAAYMFADEAKQQQGKKVTEQIYRSS